MFLPSGPLVLGGLNRASPATGAWKEKPAMSAMLHRRSLTAPGIARKIFFIPRTGPFMLRHSAWLMGLYPSGPILLTGWHIPGRIARRWLGPGSATSHCSATSSATSHCYHQTGFVSFLCLARAFHAGAQLQTRCSDLYYEFTLCHSSCQDKIQPHFREDQVRAFVQFSSQAMFIAFLMAQGVRIGTVARRKVFEASMFWQKNCNKYKFTY